MADSVSFGPCHGGADQTGSGRGSTLLGESTADFCCYFTQDSGHSAVRVKNTFIQAFLIDEDSDDEDELPMVAAKTCPLVRMCSGSTMSTSAGESSSDDSPGRHWPVARPRGAEQQQQEVAPSQGEAAQKELPRPQIAPLELRTPEVSVGSLLHETGGCKPCAWFWRLQGCDNGSECRHCHLCSAGELKARRKARIGATWKSGRGSKAVAAAAAAAASAVTPAATAAAAAAAAPAATQTQGCSL